jgi:hypothetical protein
MLHLLYTSDLPQASNVTIDTFSDDTAILICHTDVLLPRVPKYTTKLASSVEIQNK